MNKKIFNNAIIITIFTLIIIGISLLSLFVISKMENPPSITDSVKQLFIWVTITSAIVLLFVGLPFLIIGAITKKPEPQRESVTKDRYCPNCKRQIPLESKICPFCRRDFERYQ
jgi:hypothetical protein